MSSFGKSLTRKKQNSAAQATRNLWKSVLDKHSAIGVEDAGEQRTYYKFLILNIPKKWKTRSGIVPSTTIHISFAGNRLEQLGYRGAYDFSSKGIKRV